MNRDRFAQTPRRSQAATSIATNFYRKLQNNPNEQPKHLELLFKALKTIKTTKDATTV